MNAMLSYLVKQQYRRCIVKEDCIQLKDSWYRKTEVLLRQALMEQIHYL